MAGEREVHRGFGWRAEADHRERVPALRNPANGDKGALPVGKEHGVKVFAGRNRHHAHNRLGQNPQAALRTQHHLPQVRSGRRCRKGRELERSYWRLYISAYKELLDPAVAE